MQVLIVSDNHGDVGVLNKLVEKYQAQVDYMVHCGDSEMTSDDLMWGTMTTVRGNTDTSGFKDIEIISTEQGNIVVAHGHLHQVKQTLDQLVDLAKQNKAEVICYGHTHVMDNTIQEGILVINPGSISLPRGRYPLPTYAILEWHGGEKKVTFYNINHEAITT